MDIAHFFLIIMWARARPINASFQCIFVLVFAMLVVEAFAVVHAVEHSLSTDADVCIECDKADLFQYGLTDSVQPVSNLRPQIFVVPAVEYFIYIQFFGRSCPRGPPSLRSIA